MVRECTIDETRNRLHKKRLRSLASDAQHATDCAEERVDIVADDCDSHLWALANATCASAFESRGVAPVDVRVRGVIAMKRSAREGNATMS